MNKLEAMANMTREELGLAPGTKLLLVGAPVTLRQFSDEELETADLIRDEHEWVNPNLIYCTPPA
jgi:hypothetical protein